MTDGCFLFVSDKEAAEARENRVPANTRRHTLWSTNVYKHWAKARNDEFRDFTPENTEFPSVPSTENLTVKKMNYWLSKFALEVRKKDGSDYRSEVLNSFIIKIKAQQRMRIIAIG